MRFYLPIVIMALATASYHIAQKSVPSQINLLLSLAVNYITALAGTALLLPLYPPHVAGSMSLSDVNWSSYAVGASIVGVKLAVLLAYRAGWKISLASVVGNSASALILVAVGLFFFHERLSLKSAAGITLCLLGLAFIAQGRPT